MGRSTLGRTAASLERLVLDRDGEVIPARDSGIGPVMDTVEILARQRPTGRWRELARSSPTWSATIVNSCLLRISSSIRSTKF
jgi:hypothetical protein